MVYSDPNIIITTLNISELNSWLNDRDLILEFYKDSNKYP